MSWLKHIPWMPRLPPCAKIYQTPKTAGLLGRRMLADIATFAVCQHHSQTQPECGIMGQAMEAITPGTASLLSAGFAKAVGKMPSTCQAAALALSARLCGLASCVRSPGPARTPAARAPPLARRRCHHPKRRTHGGLTVSGAWGSRPPRCSRSRLAASGTTSEMHKIQIPRTSRLVT